VHLIATLLLLLQDSPASLTRALRWTYITGGTLTLVLVVAWPLLALPAGVFSKGYFTMWIIIAIVWGLLASGEPFVRCFLETKNNNLHPVLHLLGCFLLHQDTSQHPAG
jgi:hypothetical protein